MSDCGCGKTKCGGDCGCGGDGFSSEGIERAEFAAATYPGYKESPGGRNCVSNKGKFFDLTTEDFIVPEVGREAYIKVCEGKLWKAKQYIGVFYGANFAAFKITQVGTGKLKVLNGCDKSGDNPFIGNPDKGTNIPEGSVLCAIPPTGCSSDLTLRIIEVLTTKGAPAVLDVLANSEEICFTSAATIGEDEETHLFGGTKPDCDCAPDETAASCLRKLVNLFTDDGGRTLCSPSSPIINEASVDGVPKRIALFDELGCIHRGPAVADFKSCSNFDDTTEADDPIDAIIVCVDGKQSVIEPSAENLVLTTRKFTIDEVEVTKWVVQDGTKQYAILQHKTGVGTAGGSAVLGSWLVRPITDVVSQSSGLVSPPSSNKFTILKPGKYLIEWSCKFYYCGKAQSRIINTADSADVHYSLTVSPDGSTDSTSTGYAFVEVTTTKEFTLEYRCTANRPTDGLGDDSTFGTNVHANILITSLNN